MKKVIRTTIVCLLIPSLVFAQIPRYKTNEQAVKQTDLARLWNALNTDVGQQIISYIETTVGSINIEQAKAFTTAEGEIAFVPIKSYSKVLAGLCYRQLKDGSEYLLLITYNAAEKGVSFTFPSGQMYVLQASGVKESLNPDFQFQPYDDLSNKVSNNHYDYELIIFFCAPVGLIVVSLYLILLIICNAIPTYIACQAAKLTLIFLFLSTPLLFIVPAYPDLNLEISILFAIYYYACGYIMLVGLFVPYL